MSIQKTMAQNVDPVFAALLRGAAGGFAATVGVLGGAALGLSASTDQDLIAVAKSLAAATLLSLIASVLVYAAWTAIRRQLAKGHEERFGGSFWETIAGERVRFLSMGPLGDKMTIMFDDGRQLDVNVADIRELLGASAVDSVQPMRGGVFVALAWLPVTALAGFYVFSVLKALGTSHPGLVGWTGCVLTGGALSFVGAMVSLSIARSGHRINPVLQEYARRRWSTEDGVRGVVRGASRHWSSNSVYADYLTLKLETGEVREFNRINLTPA